MKKTLKNYIEDGTLQHLGQMGIVPLTVLTKVYIWERVQIIRDQNPDKNKMSAVQEVALECRLDDSTVLRSYNFVNKII